MANIQHVSRIGRGNSGVPASSEVCVLSSKMRIAVHSGKLGKSSQKHVGFYMKYASFVFRTLRKPSFQKFLRWMLRKEDIEEQMVEDVQIRVLPFKRKNGKGLAGNCNTDKGRVRIYPRTLISCRKLVQESGKAMFLSYVRIWARAALIHELLHLKYVDNEEKVRELTREYFRIFARNRPAQNSQMSSIYSMVFRSEAI